MKLNSCCWFSVCISLHLDAIVKALSQKVQDFLFLYQTEDQGAMRRNVGWNAEIPYNAKQYQVDDEFSCLDARLEQLRTLKPMFFHFTMNGRNGVHGGQKHQEKLNLFSRKTKSRQFTTLFERFWIDNTRNVLCKNT